MSISFETLALAKRYTNSAIAEAMGGVSKIDFRFVTSLPLAGETGVIYCVSNGGSEPDLYDEYYYVNGRFERIPGATIDLTPYATKAWVTGEGYYKKPGNGIPGTDLDATLRASIAKAETALQQHQSLAAYRTATQQDEHDAAYIENLNGKPNIDLGVTGAAAGQFMKVKTVDANGKPTAWETESIKYTLTVTVLTQDGITVTGQTVTVREGGADGQVFATAAYNGQPVSFAVPVGFSYYVSVSDNLASHFNPTTATGIVTNTNLAVTLTYSNFSSIRTARDIQAALDAEIDLTELVGEQITCPKGNSTLTWDVADYDETAEEITLMTYETLPTQMQFEPPQALAYFEEGLAAGNYKFKNGNTYYYFTLTKAIPEGGQLRATTSQFQVYETQATSVVFENGTVRTEELTEAVDLGTCGTETGTYPLNHMDRVNNGSNNIGESGLLQWINSTAEANEPMPRITKFSRPYIVNVAGFLSDLDPDFLDVISETDWKCASNSTYECPASLGGICTKQNVYTVRAKFCLASEKEIFGSYINLDDGDHIFDLYKNAVAADRIKRYYPRKQ